MIVGFESWLPAHLFRPIRFRAVRTARLLPLLRALERSVLRGCVSCLFTRFSRAQALREASKLAAVPRQTLIDALLAALELPRTIADDVPFAGDCDISSNVDGFWAENAAAAMNALRMDIS